MPHLLPGEREGAELDQNCKQDDGKAVRIGHMDAAQASIQHLVRRSRWHVDQAMTGKSPTSSALTIDI